MFSSLSSQFFRTADIVMASNGAEIPNGNAHSLKNGKIFNRAEETEDVSAQDHSSAIIRDPLVLISVIPC